MKLYSDSTPRFAVQIAADFAVACWIVLWIWLGTVVHDGIEVLADPGERISAAADDLAGSLGDAGDALDDAPVIGDEVAQPFESAAEASTAIGDAGDSEAEAARRLAFWAGIVVAVLPILYVGRRYVPWRLRFLLDATAATTVLRGDADLDLFAWRAVTTMPLSRVVRVSDDPLGAMRRGDRDVVRRLAELELRRLGVEDAEPGTREPSRL
ncbi:MAG: hypothetical protein JWN84_38 [Nocardioides sp.]|jgi:hypothetical protein|nr:hypothetical protein [Nocardioides sp.]